MKRKSGDNLNAEVSASCVRLNSFTGAYLSIRYLPLADNEDPLYREDIFLYSYPLYIRWDKDPRNMHYKNQPLDFLFGTKDETLSAELKMFRLRFSGYEDFKELCEKSEIVRLYDECSNIEVCFKVAEQNKGATIYTSFDYDKYLTRVGVPTCLYPECVRQLNAIRKQANKELWAIKKGLK